MIAGMIAAVEAGHKNPCVVRWTGRMGLKVITQTYCGREVSAGGGVLQLPASSKLCLECQKLVSKASES